jgi:hypothetical protein
MYGVIRIRGIFLQKDGVIRIRGIFLQKDGAGFISRPIAPVSSMAGGDNARTTQPRRGENKVTLAAVDE